MIFFHSLFVLHHFVTKGGDTTCGGLVEDSYVVLHETAEACCSSEYLWMDVDLCAARSTQTSRGKYWADKTNGKCLKDYEVRETELDVQMFDSINECCEFGVFWLTKAECYASSGFSSEEADDEKAGSNMFYVNWILEQCVRDCEGPAPCGGLAQAWDHLYMQSIDCCARLPGIPKDKCIYS